MNYQSPIEGCEEALRQLKKNVAEATELFNNIVTVVRCKDCKYWENTSELFGKCEKWHLVGVYGADWFCADGKRRDDDD